MRALPPLTLSLTNHRTWNAGVCGLAALACAAATAWVFDPSHAPGMPALIGLLAGIAAIVGLAWGGLLRGPVQLRWDGQGWQAGEPPHPADCRLALDLGAWMLLRCRSGGSVTWLPLHRAHFRADWHALRCIVRAPRPAVVHDAPGGPVHPAR